MNPADPYQHIKDYNHVRLLAIFHCVYGGLCVVCGIGLIVFAVAMMSFFSSVISTAASAPGWATSSTHATTLSHGTGTTAPPAPSSTPATTGNFATTSGTYAGTGHSTHSGPPPKAVLDTMDKFMTIYGLIYAMVGAIVIIVGILSFISAHKMRNRQALTFSLVVAGINCLFIPLGTTLGVFAFVVLLRPSVSAEYERAAANQ